MLNSLIGIIASSGGVTSTNSYESIATVTLGSNTSTITFSSIPSTYAALQFRIYARSTIAGTNADNVAFRINGDSAANYTTHQLRGTTVVTANAFANLNDGYFPSAISSTGHLSNVYAGIIAEVYDYSSTNKTKTFRALSGFDENNFSGNSGAPNVQLTSMLWNNTAAMTSITFATSSQFAAGTQIALYGIKG